MAASSKNLKTLIAEGKLREEVYYRLNVVDIDLPPLREQQEDIQLLANFFLKNFNRKHGKNISAISDRVKSVLFDCQFPGNVRELENIIQRAVAIAESDTIQVEHLPPALRQNTEDSELSTAPPNFQIAKQQAIKNFKRQFIIRCLKQTNGNITQAARRCGMHVKNFFEKVMLYGINAADFRDNK